MSAGNVHLIVTGTPRKSVSAGETVFPDERNAGDIISMSEDI